MDKPLELRTSLDWAGLAPLRLRARVVAEGAYAGAHRSARRGAGVEFGGHREYVPGDDLRWLDRRSMLRHERLLVRQFETETDRALRLVVDATSSMGYRGARASLSKLAWASLVSGALAWMATTGGDPVGLEFVGGGARTRPVPCRGGGETFERIVAALEVAEAGDDAQRHGWLLDRPVDALARTARRGSFIVLLSDLLDLGAGADERVASLAARGRVLLVVHVLDPDEADFPFEGTVRLRALEGDAVVETDGAEARAAYLDALGKLSFAWEQAVTRRGGRFVRATTADDPVRVVRKLVEAAR